MRVVREQMLCVVSPALESSENAVRAAKSEICSALSASGIVHFAAFTLLPRPQGAPVDAPASLLFELSVEEGLRPVDTIASIVQVAFEPLWRIYGSSCHRPGADKITWLREYLLQNMTVADGGFVGARDRGITRIHAEARLLQAVVAAAALVAPSARAKAQSFCCALIGSVFAQPACAWALERAPRSFWRGKASSLAAKSTLFVVAVLVLAAFAYTILKASVWATAHVPARLAWPFDAAASASRIFLDIGGWSLRTLGTALLTLLTIAALRFFFPPFRRLLSNIDSDLDRAEAKPIASFYEALVATLALTSVTVVIGAFALHLETAYGASWSPLAAGFRHALHFALDNRWSLASIAATVLLGLFVMNRPQARRTSSVLAGARRGYEAIGLWRPHEIKRAQHIDPRVEACEAKLAAEGRVAHMVSLVDIRRPVPWFRFCLRVALRVITFFGHVFFTEGKLGDAPGIHFGHWHIVDNGRRLLFCSNFDGKWGGYLDDFINGASRGLNIIWRCTTLQERSGIDSVPPVTRPRDFPPTRLGLWRGVKCEQWFKAYARDSMLPHIIRYESYRFSLLDIERATALREALTGERNAVNDDRIMRILES